MSMNQSNIVLECPSCHQPLNEIIEEYRSIAVYSQVGDKFEVSERPIERLVLLCRKCEQPIPPNLLRQVEPLLPKV